MARAGFYVDGFNLYHALKSGTKTEYLVWLDLWALGQSILDPSEDLVRVCYFTAFTSWNVGKKERHEKYVRALKHRGVEVILGRFELSNRKCGGKCQEVYGSYEEKETDVNISTKIIQDATTGEVDVIYLMTGDADQVPTILAVRKLAPKTRVIPIFAPRRSSSHLRQVAGAGKDLGWAVFRNCQLPNPYVIRPGVQIECPPTWLPHTAAR